MRQNKVILTAGHLSGKSASWASPWAHEPMPMRMQEETKWPIHARGSQDYPINLQVVSSYCRNIKLFIEGSCPENKNTRFRFRVRNCSLFCLLSNNSSSHESCINNCRLHIRWFLIRILNIQLTLTGNYFLRGSDKTFCYLSVLICS